MLTLLVLLEFDEGVCSSPLEASLAAYDNKGDKWVGWTTTCNSVLFSCQNLHLKFWQSLGRARVFWSCWWECPCELKGQQACLLFVSPRRRGSVGEYGMLFCECEWESVFTLVVAFIGIDPYFLWMKLLCCRVVRWRLRWTRIMRGVAMRIRKRKRDESGDCCVLMSVESGIGGRCKIKK